MSVAPWLKWVAGAVVLVAVPAILLLRSQPGASTETSEPPPTQFTPSPVTPSSEASASGARREGPLVPELSASRSGERGDPLRVDLAVAEPCWLEIHADGELVVTGLKEEGFRQEIGASQEVRLWLGNAGGVSLRINDQRVRPLGLPGEVLKDVSITPENYTDFVVDEARRAGEARR